MDLGVRAQGVVEVAGIGGETSVFVFRKAVAAPYRVVSRQRAVRTKEQRIETTKRVSRQYATLAKVAPRRARAKVVDPENLPPEIRIKSMPREEASKLFTGVGEYYIDASDSDNAIEFFRQAVRMDEKNNIAPKGLSEALSLKGNELLVKDKPDDARTYFDEAISYNPNNAVAYYGLGEVYSGQEIDEKSIANYEKAISLDKDLTEIYTPLGILYYHAGQIAKADELLTKAAAIDTDSAITQYFLGLVRFAQNQNQKALTAFQTAIRLQPDYAEAYYYSGETLERLGKVEEAIPQYQKAVSYKPNYFEAQLSLGNAFYELKRWPEAIAEYEKAVRLKNDNVQVYLNLGDAYRENRDFEKAESRYNLAVTFMERDKSVNPDDAADTYSKIGYVIAEQCPINMSKFMPCRWETATRALEKAATLTHDNVDYANLGWAYYNAARRDKAENRPDAAREKLEKARLNLQKAASADPSARYMTASLANYGMALNDLGDYRNAVDVLNRVVKAQPDWIFANNELGYAYYGMKDYKNAIDRFEAVVKRNPDFAQGWYNLAKANYDSGNAGAAKKAYMRLRTMKAYMLADKLDRDTKGAIGK
jgi:superkiller protein 3